jgi:hypothetical protein
VEDEREYQLFDFGGWIYLGSEFGLLVTPRPCPSLGGGDQQTVCVEESYGRILDVVVPDVSRRLTSGIRASMAET